MEHGATSSLEGIPPNLATAAMQIAPPANDATSKRRQRHHMAGRGKPDGARKKGGVVGAGYVKEAGEDGAGIPRRVRRPARICRGERGELGEGN